jgi:hypothetical protein
VVAGCVMMVLVSPRLVAMLMTCVLSITWKALRRSVAGRAAHVEGQHGAAQPDCWRIASACCGCDSSPG